MGKALERSSIEAYGGVAIGVAIAVIPLLWYVQLVLVCIVGLLAGDISFRAPWFCDWSRLSKALIWMISLAIIASISFGPIKEQYRKDHEIINVFEIERLGRQLTDLSSDILAFSADRAANAPLRIQTGKSMQESWALGQHYRQESVALAYQRFGSRILSGITQLKSIDIIPPFSIRTSMLDNPAVIGRWLGAMGHLLLEGKLKEAQKTGRDAKFWWNLSY